MSRDPAPFAACSDESGYAFISYSHDDLESGFQYLASLHREGFAFWFDEGLMPTNSWTDQLAGAIDDCSLFVMLITPVAVERPVVNQEIAYALNHQKPVLLVYLEPTPLPRDLEFELGRTQAILAHEMSVEEVVEKIRQQLIGHGVRRVELDQTEIETDSESIPDGEEEDELPPPPPPPPTPVSVSDAFADREPESQALAKSVAHQTERSTGATPIEAGVYPNVLVFYGGGGVGKSGLSNRLEKWVTGDLPEGGHWGRWPGPDVVAVRWDFNDSEGDVQFADLLCALRQSLYKVDHGFLAFDLALAAYLEAVSTRDRQSLGLTGNAAKAVLASLKTIASQQKAGVPPQLDALTVQRIVHRVLKGNLSDRLAKFGLADFLLDCERIPQGSQAPALVARLIYILTQEVFRIPKDQRPALVFFIDHFERIQRSIGRSHEPDIARIIAHFPYGLFVITGRDHLDWANPGRTDLDQAGPSVWPGLAESASSNPRQHLLGRLSDEDTRKLYEQHRDQQRWNMSDDLIEKLVRRSEGLPIHIEAVIQLAQNLNLQDPGRRFEPHDLDRDLPGVVKRLLDVLTPEERKAFRAACVLPFFDIDMVKAVGGVEHGDVERAIRYGLVEENRDSLYPYRVHDEIRKLVRQDRGSHGYWGDGDWTAAARRGLAEAKRVIQVSHDAEQEFEEIEAIALAIRLAYEWDLEGTGLETAVTKAPSINVLAPLLPVLTSDEPQGEVEALIHFVHRYSLPFGQSIASLKDLVASGTFADGTAKRFLAYRQRSRGLYSDALETLREVADEYPENAEYIRFQYAVTLRNARRFRESLDYANQYVPNALRLRRFKVVVERAHGVSDGDTIAVRERAAELVKSRRVRHELKVSQAAADAQRGRIGVDRVERLLEESVHLGDRGGVRTCLRTLGYFYLADEERFNEVVELLKRGIEQDESIAGSAVHLLALRARLTSDPSDALKAREAARPGTRGPSWIPTEVWLEDLGCPLDPVETQWLIPYEQVRDNWARVGDAIIERAKLSRMDR